MDFPIYQEHEWPTLPDTLELYKSTHYFQSISPIIGTTVACVLLIEKYETSEHCIRNPPITQRGKFVFVKNGY